MSELVTPQSGSPVDQLFPYLENPNVRSFLDMIGSAEGTDKYGYNTLFGGGKVESLADHPRQLFDFTETTGRPNKTTAAGRYQFLSNTWDEQSKKLGLPDFGPQSQDLAAINLLRERGILPDVLAGNWESAVKKSGPIWASLPSSPYPQPRQSNEFVMNRLNPNNMVANASTSDVNPVAIKGLSSLSNEELMALSGQAPSAPSVGSSKGLQGLSNEELMSMSQGQPVAAPVEQKPMDWQTTLATSASNLPSSAVKYGKELYEAITNPVETVKNIGMVAAGGLKNITPEFIQKFITSIAKEPGQIDQAVQMANAVGGEYAQKYGSVDGFKKALAADPVSVIGDMSILLTGGGSVAAKVPGIARAGEIAATAGRAIDPLNLAAKAVTKPLQLAEMLATPTVAGLSGTSPSAIRQAATTGRESITDVARGTEKAQAFLDQTTGKAPATDAVQVAREAVDELRKARSAEYNTGMANIKTDKTVLDFTKIDQAIADADKYAYFKNALKNPEAAKALEDVSEIIKDWKSRPAKEYHTPEGFDNLKQAVGGVLEKYKPGTTEYKAVSEIYNAIKKDIVAQAPAYGKVMKDYLEASDTLQDLAKSLVSNDRAASDLTLRKLQSIFRNNVNTNYGSRLEKAKILEGAGADTLFPMLAGQVFNAPTARGIQGSIAPYAAGGGIVAALSNPALWPLIAATGAASSPRIVGLTSYYGGKAFGAGEKLAEALKSYTGKSPIDPYTLRMLATKLGQQQTEEQR